MRFPIAVGIGGAVIGSLMPQMWLAERLAATPAVAWIGMLVIVPITVGAVARRRGSVAAGAAFLIGIALWIALWLRPSPPWSPSDNWSLVTWTMLLVGQVAPGVLITAAVGAIGGAAARAVAGRRAATVGPSSEIDPPL